MTLLTTDQITEITDALEALGEEFGTRNWDPELATSVMSTAAASLVSVSAMRAPVPQPAYYAPPAYPYEPGDFSQNTDSASLQITVTGGNRQELEDRAYQAGLQVFGDGASLTVTLTGPIQGAGIIRDGVTQYQCGAVVRQENAGDWPATYSPRG